MSRLSLQSKAGAAAEPVTDAHYAAAFHEAEMSDAPISITMAGGPPDPVDLGSQEKKSQTPGEKSSPGSCPESGRAVRGARRKSAPVVDTYSDSEDEEQAHERPDDDDFELPSSSTEEEAEEEEEVSEEEEAESPQLKSKSRGKGKTAASKPGARKMAAKPSAAPQPPRKVAKRTSPSAPKKSASSLKENQPPPRSKAVANGSDRISPKIKPLKRPTLVTTTSSSSAGGGSLKDSKPLTPKLPGLGGLRVPGLRRKPQ